MYTKNILYKDNKEIPGIRTVDNEDFLESLLRIIRLFKL